MLVSTADSPDSPSGHRSLARAGHVKTALDVGTGGIVFSLVRTAQDAAECVALTPYPPKRECGWIGSPLTARFLKPDGMLRVRPVFRWLSTAT